MNKSVKSTILLLMAAIIWGSAFVAQRSGMDSIGPFYFCAIRSIIGSGALFVVYLITKKSSAETQQTKEEKQKENKLLLKGSLVCGLVIFCAMNSQQMGLVSVDAGKSGFLTALYIVLVPLIGIFLKHKTSLFNWVGAGLSVIGLYLLCITTEFKIEGGDAILLIGALFWALHILCINHFAPHLNVVKLNALQFFIAGIISLVIAFFKEPISMDAVTGAAVAILYTSIGSTAIAFTLQAMAQKYASPTAAAITMSTEALWAVVFGFIILGETLTTRELTGCIFMLAAVIISQLPPPKSKQLTGESADTDSNNRGELK